MATLPHYFKEAPALGLEPAAVEADAHQRVLEAWTATYRTACEGVYAELVREADAAQGETLSLYGLRDGALSPEPLMDGLSLGDGRLVDLREWEGFALVSARPYAWQQLPARDESGRAIAYSVAEEHIYGSDGADILDRFAHSASVSGTGWYVVNNQAARSVVVRKEWYGLDGDAPLTDTRGKGAVTFDLYRTTEEIGAQDVYTRAELTAFLNGATRVRADLTLSGDNGWTNTVEALEQTDSQGRACHYYALEHVPDNQEDSYVVSEASDTKRLRS